MLLQMAHAQQGFAPAPKTLLKCCGAGIVFKNMGMNAVFPQFFPYKIRRIVIPADSRKTNLRPQTGGMAATMPGPAEVTGAWLTA